MAIDGALYPNSRTRLAQITDGTSHTVAIGERLYFSGGVNGDWMIGATRVGHPPTRICSASSKNIRFPINADPQQIGYFVGDRQAPPDGELSVLLNDLYFGSDHPGGAQFGFVDGSVRFLVESIDFVAYQNISTIQGGESHEGTE